MGNALAYFYPEPFKILTLGLEGGTLDAINSECINPKKALQTLIAGKTTIFYMMRLSHQMTPIPHKFLNITKWGSPNWLYKDFNFIEIDIPNNKNDYKLLEPYFDNISALIWVIDSFNTNTLRESKDSFIWTVNHSKCLNIPILIFINKQDLPRALELKEIKEFFGLKEPSNYRNIKYSIFVDFMRKYLSEEGIIAIIYEYLFYGKIENCIKNYWERFKMGHIYMQTTCATTGDGLLEGFDWLRNKIKKKFQS